jgi:hypothetical protein
MIALMNEDFIEGYLFERGENGALTPYLYTSSTYTAKSKYTSETVVIELSYMTHQGEQKAKHIRLHQGTLLETYKSLHSEKAAKLEKEIAALEEEAEELQSELSEIADSDDSRAEKQKQKKPLQARLEEIEKEIRSKLAIDVTIENVLNLLGFYKETEKLMEDYQKQVGRFMKLVTGFGKQLRVRGEGRHTSSGEDDDDRYHYWYSSRQSMAVDGRPGRAIMDTIPLQSQATSESRQIRRNRRDVVDEELSQDSVEDVANLTVEDFFKKIDVASLTKNTHSFADSPPTKTILSVPLHPVLKVFHLEKHAYYNVHAVNATYYKYKPELIDSLILDPDILEIARLLEYYRGTLILTTNQTRPDGQSIDVDDAILQRSSAVVHFEIPNKELSMNLWKVHLNNLKIKLPVDDLKKAVANTRLSGRTIRQVLRSAKRLSIARKVDITYELLEVAAKFIAITKGEKGFGKPVSTT